MSTSRPTAILFGERPDALRGIARGVDAAGGEVALDGPSAQLALAGRELEILHLTGIEEVLAHLDSAYVNLLLLDLRAGEDGPDVETLGRTTRELLTRLDEVKDVEARFGFHRILALVPPAPPEAVDTLLVHLGAHGVQHVLRDHEAPSEPFGARVLREVVRLVDARRVGQTALCLSGGGTTGIYFELGALKCLADCLPRDSLQRFDMIFGISAGAVVGSTLAAGFSVDEFMASIAEAEGSRMPALDFRVGRPADFNWRDGVARFRRFLTSSVLALTRSRRSSALLPAAPPPWPRGLRSLVGPFFRLERLERALAELFEIAGIDNRFDRTVTRFYVGASDQDRREHVLFGDTPFRDVPISRAVQASAAFSPAFHPVEIDGRFYEDGAVTQTSNFGEAFERGATLTLVVDPFLPHVSSVRGAASRGSVFYQVDQIVRTMSFTRFEEARAHMIRKHPEVSMYTFLPSNRLRHLLAENPLDDRRYLEIWRAAYLSTHARLARLEHRMKGDFWAHGLELDLERAGQVAEQLLARPVPTFEDFYPDRQVVIPHPPLPRDQAPRPRPERSSLVPSAA